MKKILKKKETEAVVMRKDPEEWYMGQVKLRFKQLIADAVVGTALMVGTKFLPVPPLAKIGIIVAIYVGESIVSYKILDKAMDEAIMYDKLMGELKEELGKDISSDDVRFEVIH